MLNDLSIKISADASGVKRELRQTSRTINQVDRQLNQNTRTWRDWSIRSVAATIALAMAVSRLAKATIDYADTYQSLSNKLRVVVNETQDLSKVTEEMFAMANANRVSVEGTVDVYTKLKRATKDLGLEEAKLTEITDTIQKAFIIGGATAKEMDGAIRQLGQALASGALRGEEFNSVSEQAPVIMEAIKNITGENAGALRKWAAEGAITTEVIIQALSQYRDEAVRLFGETEATFSQNVAQARNNAIQFVGTSEELRGAVQSAGEGILYLSENIGTLAEVGKNLAIVYGATLVNAIFTSSSAKAAYAMVTGKAAQATIAESAANVKLAQAQVAVATNKVRDTSLALKAAQQSVISARGTNMEAEAIVRLNAALQAHIANQVKSSSVKKAATAAEAAHTAAVNVSTASLVRQNVVLGVRNFLMGNWATLAVLASYGIYSLVTAETDAERQIKATSNAIKFQMDQMKELSDQDLATRIKVNTDAEARYSEQLEKTRKTINRLKKDSGSLVPFSDKKEQLERLQEKEKELEAHLARVSALKEGSEKEQERRKKKSIDLAQKQVRLSQKAEEEAATKAMEKLRESLRTEEEIENNRYMSALKTAEAYYQNQKKIAGDNKEEQKQAELEHTMFLEELERQHNNNMLSIQKKADQEKKKQDAERKRQERESQKREDFIRSIQDRFKTKAELEKEAYEEERRLFVEAAEKQKMGEAEKNQTLQDMESEHQLRMAEIRAEGSTGSKFLDGLRDSFMTEQEILAEQYLVKEEMLRAHLEANKLSEEEYAELSRQLAERNAQEIASIEVDKWARIKSAQVGAFKSGIDLMKTFQGKSKAINRAIFLAEKAAALAEAYVAANVAYVKGFSIDPTGTLSSILWKKSMLSIAAIAASTISGYSSSGGGGGGGGGSISSSSSSGASGLVGQGGGGAQSRNITIALEGGGLFSAEQVRELIGQINEQVGDGVQINTGGG